MNNPTPFRKWHTSSFRHDGEVVQTVYTIIDNNYVDICDVMKSEDDVANARLIAASPHLLAALEEVARSLNRHISKSGASNTDMVALGAAKHAIALAKGEEL